MNLEHIRLWLSNPNVQINPTLFKMMDKAAKDYLKSDQDSLIKRKQEIETELENINSKIKEI